MRRLIDLNTAARSHLSDLVALIAEMDKRKLYARESAPSMFAWCRDVLHLSEAEAFLRIRAARASRRYPAILEMLANGRLHLTAVAKLAPHLNKQNAVWLLQRASNRSKGQLAALVAEIAPQPDVLPTVRRLPAPALRAAATAARDIGSGYLEDANGDGASMLGALPFMTMTTRVDDSDELCPGGVRGMGVGATGPNKTQSDAARSAAIAAHGADSAAASAPLAVAGEGTDAASPTRDEARSFNARSASVQALSPGRFKVQFTADEGLRAKLERIQALMPGIDLASIIDAAVSEKLQRIEARRFGTSRRKPTAQTVMSPARHDGGRPPQPHFAAVSVDGPQRSRHIPAAVRRAVHARDGGQCRFVNRNGVRCRAREQLEFHHRHPFAMGGANSIDNIRLMCRTHNAYLAEADYGTKAMGKYRSREG